MAQNTLTDLQNHLFTALERLNDESLDADAVQQEIERSRAVADIGKVVIANANTEMQAIRLRAALCSNGKPTVPFPKMLGDGNAD